MRIHFYILTSFPNAMAAGRRRLCYAKGLIAAGNTVNVAVCRKVKEDNCGLSDRGIYQGINYDFVCGRFLKQDMKCKSNTLIDYIKGFIYALNHIKKGDIVYCYFYSLIFHLLLIIAAKIKGAKIVREVCEYPFVFGKQTIKIKFLRWIELNFLFPLFDGFIPISHSLNALVRHYKSKHAKSIIIPILVDDMSICKDTRPPYDVHYIIHTGTMIEQKDGISIILRAFAKARKKVNAKIVFTGPQANDKCPYNNLIDELGIKGSVELLGFVSKEEIDRLQYFASLSIVYKPDNTQTRNCFPTKLGEVLLNGIPVITTNIGDANRYLKNGESAYIIQEGDIDGLSDAIVAALSNLDASKQIGRNGQTVALKNFSPIIQGKRISNFYHTL